MPFLLHGFYPCNLRVFYMFRYIFFLCLFLQEFVFAASVSSFPPSGMTLPEYWGEEQVWWHGRATFKGQVVVSSCSLAMEDAWQSVDMGSMPVRKLQNSSVGPEKMFRLQLRGCRVTGHKLSEPLPRVWVTFDGIPGDTPDTFRLSGQAKGVGLQILDSQGYTARAGEVMSPQFVYGNENNLNFMLRVVRTGQPLYPGDYHSVLRFRVYYE